MLYQSRLSKLFDGINIMLLIVVGGIMVFPFINLISVSFSSYNDILSKKFILWPTHWDISAYQYILSSAAFRRSMLTTIYITTFGTITNLFFTTTMAYGLTRPIFGQRVIMLMIVFTLLFSAGIIPTYLIVNATGLLNSIWSLIIPVAISSFYLIITRQFFLNIPLEITEAATIDGASPMQIFSRMILPLSKPALAAFGLFYAVNHWNNYFGAIIYINDATKWPVQIVVRQIVLVTVPNAALGSNDMQRFLTNPPPAESVQMAAILLSTLPILILYPFLQKYFAKGVLLGSIKG